MHGSQLYTAGAKDVIDFGMVTLLGSLSHHSHNSYPQPNHTRMRSDGNPEPRNYTTNSFAHNRLQQDD